MIGGQYLLQGVAEEKESRILESMMCQVSAEELMAGKLLGLGAVGLVTVGTWVAATLLVSAPALSMLPITARPAMLGVATLYFLFGYLFFGSIMTGIGALTNNMREAQQFAVWFTLANFAPFILITTILGHPDGPLPFWLSLFPPTASTTMMMRLGASNSTVPFWQVAASLTLLAVTGLLVLRASARIFRIGLLMYGKTPTLREIVRWARSA
jgi:ABC-2 type transport system permease protein